MFTKEKPTAVGWYFWRRPKHSDAVFYLGDAGVMWSGCEVLGLVGNTWDASEFLRIPDPPAR